MFTLKKTFSILSLGALLLVACSPEDGDTGPAGPVGPEGALGPAGQDGTIGRDGVDGLDGKAAVAYTYNISSADWNSVSNGGLNSIEDTIQVPQITQNIYNGGALLVYMKENSSDPSWQPLPYQNYIVYNNGTANVFSIRTYQASFSVGALNIRSFINSNISLTTNAGIVVKLVIVPPAAKIADFDPKSYEEVKMVYGIED